MIQENYEADINNMLTKQDDFVSKSNKNSSKSSNASGKRNSNASGKRSSGGSGKGSSISQERRNNNKSKN